MNFASSMIAIALVALTLLVSTTSIPIEPRMTGPTFDLEEQPQKATARTTVTFPDGFGQGFATLGEGGPTVGGQAVDSNGVVIAGSTADTEAGASIAVGTGSGKKGATTIAAPGGAVADVEVDPTPGA